MTKAGPKEQQRRQLRERQKRAASTVKPSAAAKPAKSTPKPSGDAPKPIWPRWHPDMTATERAAYNAAQAKYQREVARPKRQRLIEAGRKALSE